jgi:amino acid transporter/nucleotide-binding universal stress UspA family protein
VASAPRASDSVRVRVTRDLGLFDVTMAAVGSMVGAAVFLLLGAAFSVAGGWVLVSVALAAVLALLVGMAYAELASGRPDASGGAYVWVRTALPPPSGFLSGWLAWSGAMATASLSALGLGLFLMELIQPGTAYFGASPADAPLVGALVLAVAAATHVVRLHWSAKALARLTLVKVVLIVVLLAVGLAAFLPGSSSAFPGPSVAPAGVLGFVLGAGIFFIAFQGFEIVAQLSDQAKAPERTVPRGIFLAVAISLGVYILFFLAVLTNVPATYLAGWPVCAACHGASEDMFFAALGNFAFGQAGIRVALLVLGIVSLYAALNASITSAVRTSFSMARDGLLPSVLARVGSREVPPLALVLTVLGAAVLLVLSIETLAILAGLAFLGLFAFVHGSVIALRRKERRSNPGFRMPLVPALPILAVALNLAVGTLLVNYPATGGSVIPLSTGDIATYVGLLWLALGLIYHYFAGGRQALKDRPAPARSDVTTVLTTAEDHVELERYRVFLPLREFTDTELVDFGARVARARNGELSLLNVVEIPRNLPPKAIRFRYVDDRIRGLQQLAKIGAQNEVDTRPVVKIGYKPYEIILDTIREEAVNLLVMGWRGERVEGDRRILGSNIDYLIENAPCDVVVFKTKGLQRPLKKIVVLSSPIWSLQGVGDLALILAAEERPTIDVVSLVGEPADAERVKAEATPFLQKCHQLGIPVEHRIVYSRAWEPIAIQESAEVSLLLIQASSPGGIHRYSLSPVEDRIVKLAKCPVLILRPGTAPSAG